MRRGSDKPLGKETLAVLAAIQAGPGPQTLSAIAARVEMIPQTVAYHVGRLAQAGLLAYEPRQARTIRPTCRFVRAVPDARKGE